MDPLKQSLIDASYFDQAVARLGNIPVKTIGTQNREFLRIRKELGWLLNTEDPASLSALFSLVDSARKAVNEANKLHGTNNPVPDPSRLPNIDGSPGLGGAREEVHVVVEMVDPTTGGTARFPVVIDSTTGMTQQRLEAEAAAMAVLPQHWQTSGQRGEISPETAQYVRLTIIAVISRD